ncbi:MAG: phosphatidylserine decarboxylase [Sulfurovum sp.]|jgi:phosphatidylserine decarboxylase|nr:phosphatidylserine decarboxylase [Sulfurovum sp.]
MAKHFTSVISNAFGKFASKAFPKPIQNVINKGYVSLMKLDMSEFKDPSQYPTLNALFTRSFVKERAIETDETALISPADSLITDYGKITEGKAYQIKGMSYDVDALLGDDYQGKAALLEGGDFINFYLSPKDYHRYHMPLDLKIKSLTHIPGKIYPVNMPLLRNKMNLFIENERVVIECKDHKGKMHFLVLVGALNVGKMVVTFEEKVKTNANIYYTSHYTFSDLSLKKGEMFGWFEMGSTIVILSEKESIQTEVAINQKVFFGQKIGKIF